MVGGKTMDVNTKMFVLLSEEDQQTVNQFIEFLYHKRNSIETAQAVREALVGENLVGPFDSVSDFMSYLNEED